jgi:hypothetical protein
MARPIKTVAQRIDEMLAEYAKLDHEAHQLIDFYVDELRLERPNIPIGVIKQTEVLNRAGTTLNVPRALQLVQERHG